MNKINYDRMCMAVIRQQTAAGRVPTLLLHSCCAPCSSATLEWLSQYFQITVFYYNPNIAPEGEFQKRLAEQRRLIAHQPAVHPVQLIAGDYEPAAFAAVAKGYEDCPEGGARCMRCYRQRLEKTAALAKEMGFDYFCTTLFLMLSFFPFLLFFFSLLSWTPLTESDFLMWASSFIPESFGDIMKDLASEVYASGTGRLSITMITAVYLSSKAFISFQLGLDDMYHVKENRNFILRRIYSVLYSIVFALALIFLLGIMVFGNMLRKMYFSNVHHIIGSIIGSVVDYRLVICLPVLILFFWVIYVFLPNKKHRAKYQLPGAVFAAAAWMIFSGIFSVYVDKYNNYSSFYGTMTTIALIMVWLYGCMYVLFIGGIINRTWEERMDAKKYYNK